MARVVADLGNSRLKWGLIGADGTLAHAVSLPIDDPAGWASVLDSWGLADRPSRWAIASVNPPLAGRLTAWLGENARAEVRLFRSAADVPVRNALETPETTGADRALAALEAGRRLAPGVPGQVVSCGTAITVEWISAAGIWEGGAIAPGLGLSARALHELTAQLPRVTPGPEFPRARGASTVPAMTAGLFWGAVGGLREILARQRGEDGPAPRVVWTGGEAALLAPWVSGGSAEVHHDLVLEALAALAFGDGPAP